jgi:predicted dehydrogenase
MGTRGSCDARPSSDRKIGIGVIGLRMGANMLYVNRHPSRFASEVRGICDLDADRLSEAGDRFAIPFRTQDWRQLVTRPDVDLVGIFSTDRDHMEMIRLAVEKGKHVICTKPMVVSLDEAQETVRLVRLHGRKLLVGQTRRYEALHQQVKAFYDGGTIGSALFALASYVHGDFWTVLDRGAWRYEHPKDMIFGAACHPIDHLRWYFGDVDEVHAYACPSPVLPRYPQDRPLNYTVNMRFKSGVIGQVLCLIGIHEPPGGRRGDVMPAQGLSLFGTFGTIVNSHAAWRDQGRHDAPRQEHRFPTGDEMEDFDGTEYNGHRMATLKYVHEMESCILNDAVPSVNEIEGAKCIAVCAAADESIRTGEPVKVINDF